jgi:hypothetical protein
MPFVQAAPQTARLTADTEIAPVFATVLEPEGGSE